MILLGKNEENTRMKKAKQCLIALLSGVLLVLLCICTLYITKRSDAVLQ